MLFEPGPLIPHLIPQTDRFPARGCSLGQEARQDILARAIFAQDLTDEQAQRRRR